jgi:phosphoribosylformimino-5-aminoimidazole carboxamide ribotide isomerase
MRIIPAIDIIDGKCVRLTQGDYSQKKTYSENPVEVAKHFEENGFRFLHLVDLDGARQGKVVNWNVLEKIIAETGLRVDFGGGIKTEDDLVKVFDTGAAQVNLGSIAVNRPYRVREWIEKFGADKVILSADVRDETVAINGWQENSNIDVIMFINTFIMQGLQYVACTDIASDGMLAGANIQLYKKLKAEFPLLKLIASGGIGSIKDVEDLKQIGVDGAIIGKALYENKISLKELAGKQK